jgi:hypothetical protein
MTTSRLPFSDDYDKLDRAVFPTVRRRDKYGDVGDEVVVVQGSKGDREEIGLAKIITKEIVTLHDIEGPFLRFDTQSDSDKEASESLNQFYRNPIEPDESLTLYWLRWVADQVGVHNWGEHDG